MKEGEFYLAKVFLTTPDGRLYPNKEYKIRPVLIIDYNGRCATVLPVTSCINIYPGK